MKKVTRSARKFYACRSEFMPSFHTPVNIRRAAASLRRDPPSAAPSAAVSSTRLMQPRRGVVTSKVEFTAGFSPSRAMRAAGVPAKISKSFYRSLWIRARKAGGSGWSGRAHVHTCIAREKHIIQ